VKIKGLTRCSPLIAVILQASAALLGLMARPLRLEYSGAVYHITSRGNARADIFCEDADREIFLRVLAAVVERQAWRVYAYCLMGNHYHLLVETPEPNLSRGMRQLNGIYTQRFNRRHGRVGHLLQGRFKSIVVERERYLLELSRYIALNPVRAGFTHDAGAWRWSSYRATAGMHWVPSWLEVESILGRFSTDVRAAQRGYRKFVTEGLNLPSPWCELRGQILLGTESFVHELAPKLGLLQHLEETPRVQRFAARPALDILLTRAQAKDQPSRNQAIVDAYMMHGYTLGEIARHLGLHYSTVSRIANPSMREFKT
jgi:REP element-mobilizing transposase RayT